MNFEILETVFFIGILLIITTPILLAYAFYREKQKLFHLGISLVFLSLLSIVFICYFFWDTIKYLIEIISSAL